MTPIESQAQVIVLVSIMAIAVSPLVAEPLCKGPQLTLPWKPGVLSPQLMAGPRCSGGLCVGTRRGVLRCLARLAALCASPLPTHVLLGFP
jgi:hypothetical protein